MILIADSGSTKTDWALMDHNQTVKQVKTRGLNPFYQSEEEIASELRSALLPSLPSKAVDAVFFYGAGCTPEKQPLVERALRAVLTIGDRCEVASDMLGAARALCGHSAGIACILGTGSNSCSFDGVSITANVSPLGFILGDEGSGAVLGKTLVGDVLKHQLPQELIDAFHAKYPMTAADIIDRVYRQKLPNRFLASFVPFLEEHLDHPAIYSLVLRSFQSFLERNVKQYDGWQTLPIGFIGSIAHFYRRPLEDALKSEGMHLGHIIQAPMEGLIDYHRIDAL
jgi:N-acetylglucosamine kinase-like BadF-type ATPase